MSLSLLVIACNEEHRLAACIASARVVVDQVVVVVQESHDRTLGIARELADVVIEHPCHGTSEPSRPDGLAACTGEWVLNLDADEVLTANGRRYIRMAVEDTSGSVTVLKIRVKVWAGDHLLQDTSHARLFRKHGVEYGLECHSVFKPLPSFASIVVSGQPWIESRKTWREQKEDDSRYARLGGHTRSAAYPTRPHFRPGTTDQGVWDAIVGSHNEYHLPNDMTGWAVLDIGGHIGSFARACLDRGAAFVLSVEPDRSSFDVLCHNLAPYGSRVCCVRAAVWRSDPHHESDRLCPSGYGSPGPTCNPAAASVMLSGDYEEVACLAFDRLVAMLGEPDLVKLDCEGSEGPILHTSKLLGQCKIVTGEWHTMHDPAFQEHSPVEGITYSPESLKGVLEANGFSVEMRSTAGTGLGLFTATRKPPFAI